jgi:hypothetical protein
MEVFWIFIGIMVLVGLIASAFGSESHSLETKFNQLGILAGKTRAEIISSTGEPTSISAMGDGKLLLQWMETGYHIALVFKDDVCEGVSHVFKAPKAWPQ